MLARLFSGLLSGFGRSRRLTADEMVVIATVAEQVVLCLEQTMRLSGPQKKELALKVAASLLEDSGIVAPEGILDTAIEAAVRVMRLLERRAAS